MKYKKAVLICLPKQDLYRPPGAIPILASACEEQNLDYEILDFNLWLAKNTNTEVWNLINDNWDAVDPFQQLHTEWYQIFLEKLEQFVGKILEQSPDLVIISVFSDLSACPCVEMLKILNRYATRKDFQIVIGGTGIRARIPQYQRDLCQELLETGLINYYIFGEGEVAFRRLLAGETGQGINDYDAQQIDNLDQFPFPSYKKINPNLYQYSQRPEIVITGSRGCVRKCTYCDVARYWPKFRYRTGSSIAHEMLHYWQTVGVKQFEFSDSLINGNLKQFKLMNQTLLELKQKYPGFDPSYKGQFICRDKNNLKEQDYTDMAEAGCKYLYVGVESFSDQIRWDMDKKFNNKDLAWHLEMCGKYGIQNSFLMLIGYPTEQLSDHQKNLDWILDNQHYAQAGVITMIGFGYTAGILEDTPLFHMQDKLDIVKEYEDADEIWTSNWVSMKNPQLTLKERIRRWVELTDLASSLGYVMPRNKHYLKRFINILSTAKHKKKTFRLDVLHEN
jgi:radical SAM superfamily enzyme YgiQ (UPF0313 family)